MKNLITFYFLFVSGTYFCQSDSLSAKTITLKTNELILKNHVIDSLLTISIRKTRKSEVKDLVLSYSMYILNGNNRLISIVINTNDVDLGSNEFIGFFSKDGYKIYCFGNSLLGLCEVPGDNSERTIRYTKWVDDLDYIIETNLIDERKIMKSSVILNDLRYKLFVESVPR